MIEYDSDKNCYQESTYVCGQPKYGNHCRYGLLIYMATVNEENKKMAYLRYLKHHPEEAPPQVVLELISVYPVSQLNPNL